MCTSCRILPLDCLCCILVIDLFDKPIWDIVHSISYRCKRKENSVSEKSALHWDRVESFVTTQLQSLTFGRSGERLPSVEQHVGTLLSREVFLDVFDSDRMHLSVVELKPRVALRRRRSRRSTSHQNISNDRIQRIIYHLHHEFLRCRSNLDESGLSVGTQLGIGPVFSFSSL